MHGLQVKRNVRRESIDLSGDLSRIATIGFGGDLICSSGKSTDAEATVEIRQDATRDTRGHRAYRDNDLGGRRIILLQVHGSGYFTASFERGAPKEIAGHFLSICQGRTSEQEENQSGKKKWRDVRT